ncbi:hypothetical protein ACLRGI_07265 [Paenarthrobacter nitroguajacolicus]|uniref:hypothetical protein n=1 Tax=Paenarthrobacter nitroguajacolicus TaxID=211146 RepID=UPI003AE3421A
MSVISHAEYFLDETSLCLGEISDDAISVIFSQLADVLLSARSEGSDVHCLETIWELMATDNRSLSDILFLPGIDRDVRNRLSGMLQKCQNWAATDDVIGQKSEDQRHDQATSRAFQESATRMLSGTPSAVLSTILRAYSDATEAWEPHQDASLGIFVISNNQHFKLFWRQVPSALRASITSVEQVARRAFPTLIFVDRVWNGVKDFDGDESTMRDTLIVHLSALDDHFLEIYTSTNDPNRIAAEMGSRAGVDCSKESNKTRRNSKAMSTRVRSVNDENVTFEWHTKFDRYKNRVHFAIYESRLHVGIFCRHLDI